MVVPDPLQFPEGTIDVDQLRTAVRQWLRHGLTEKFMRTCVRIGGFRQFSGGLKASLVGGAVIHLNTVIKLGDQELYLHDYLITAINKQRPRTFASIEHVESLPNGRVLLLMEDLRRYETLLSVIFSKPFTLSEVRRILGHAFDALSLVHRQRVGGQRRLQELPQTPQPFTSRIESKFDEIIRSDSDLAALRSTVGAINGRAIPPLRELLQRARLVEARCSRHFSLRLVHGDAHIGNIMLRRRGPKGFSVRLIDPNPNIGFSHPLYDVGKMLHWMEPVGWIKYGRDAKTRYCRATWRQERSRWKLDAGVRPASKAAESRRAYAEKEVRGFAENYRDSYGADFDSMLALSTAAAHVGLAALYRGTDLSVERRAVIASVLTHLTRIRA